MEHGAGTDMQDMVRHICNRFWISLAVTPPIFALDPMDVATRTIAAALDALEFSDV